LYYDRELVVDLDDNANIGRLVCSARAAAGWKILGGFGYAGCIFLLAVAVSWNSRSLPSAFNEKDQIFRAATFSAIFASVLVAFEATTNDATDSPDRQVSMR
jgi:hypothetical protein